MSVQDDHEEIEELMRGVQELSNLFFFLGAITDDQAEALKSIEESADDQVYYAAKGTSYVERAQAYQ